MFSRFFLIVFLLLFVRCESESDTDDVCSTLECEFEATNVLSKLDESVDPCEDFYLFACGNFINETAIPDDRASVNSFSILDDILKKQLSEALSSLVTADDNSPLTNCQKLYNACMNQGQLPFALLN